MSNFAVLDIAYTHTTITVTISITTNNPCHLTCYYTDKNPLRHRTSRNERGLTLPWGVYFCFVAWKSLEQIEPGDTLYHTFEIPDWSFCQTKWFAFRGTISEELSPSVTCIFEHHHPGITTSTFTLKVMHDYDDYRRVTPTLYQVCPSSCPPVLRAGSQAGADQGMGLRFRSVPIPPRSTIDTAHLIITSERDNTMACGTRISAEKADNPPDFSADTYLIARTRWENRTEARVEWDFAPTDVWVKDVEYNTPELKTIIQEIINRPGWVKNNALVLFWNDWDGETLLSSSWRSTYPHHISSPQTPRLFIKYTY